MAKLNKTRTVAAALLGTIVLAAPVTSFAQDFRTVSNGFDNCRVDNRNNQIAGGVFGAVVGGVLGSQLSGRNARTGSTIAGASLGAITGSALGGTARNCQTAQVRTINSPNTVFAAPPVQTFGSNRVVTSGISTRGFQQASLRKDIKVERRLNQIERELYAADLKLEKLVYEKERLVKRSRFTRTSFSHGNRGIGLELRKIDREIAIVKDCKIDLKREAVRLERKLYY